MRVPNVVKNIPMPVVRALPTLYYYGYFASKSAQEKAKNEFLSHLGYLQRALVLLNEFVADGKLEKIIEVIDSINPDFPQGIASKIYDLTFQISQICQRNKEKIDQAIKRNDLEKTMKDLFEKTVAKRKILVIDNQGDADFSGMIVNRLIEKCFYQASRIYPQSENIADSIIESDFLLFTSAAPQTIHDDVAWLKSYNKPGLVLGNLQKDKNLNQQIIRNGAWLRSRGFYVLFKIYTPLRLFTTIDKVFMRFLCQGN